MKSVEEIIAFVAERIGYIYHHGSLKYGGTPEGVDLLLHSYHELWAEIAELQYEYRDVSADVCRDEGCNACGFADHYANSHPEATTGQIAEYVVMQWRKISDRLGVPIPHERIIQKLDQEFGR